jgi:hypothetical protein
MASYVVVGDSVDVVVGDSVEYSVSDAFSLCEVSNGQHTLGMFIPPTFLLSHNKLCFISPGNSGLIGLVKFATRCIKGLQ